MKSIRMPRIAAAALSVSLGLVSFAALADDTSTPQQQPVPQQTAQNPATPGVMPQTMAINPNTIPPSSELRNGDGAPLDPQSGLPDSSYVEKEGF